MKRTQLKDALRNIWKQKVSWFAIVVIAMLSVMAYLGINFASRGIAGNGNAFYDETHFRDAEIISTLLVTPDDMDAILAVEGVADAEGVYQTSGKLENKGVEQNVDVVSLTERINTPQLLEGRLPETDGECAVEKAVMDALELSVGDTIFVTDARGDRAAYLLRNEFVITGVVNHPDHAVWPLQIPGNRDVIVLSEAFDREALDGCYMKAELLVDGTAGMDRFGAEYKAVVSEVMGRLETLSADRTAIRSGEIQARYQDEIDSGRAELDNGRVQLEEARAELDDGWTALAEGEQTLADGAEQLADAESQLQDAWQQLLDAQAELADAEEQLASAKSSLDSGAAELRSAEAQLASARSELISGWEQLEDAKETIRSMIRSGVESAIGSEAAAAIPWASRQSADLSSSGASAADFWITDSVRFDMSLSLQENVMRILTDSGIPDETLIAAYEGLMGGGDP